jgi:hypothetical protein
LNTTEKKNNHKASVTKEMCVKKRLQYLLAIVAVPALCFHPVYGQEFSGIIKEMNAIEQRLTKKIDAETAQRKQADIARGNDASAAVTTASPDSITAAAIEAITISNAENKKSIDSAVVLLQLLLHRVDSLTIAQQQLQAKTATDTPVIKPVSAVTNAIPKAGDTIPAQAADSGESAEKEAMEIGGLVTVDAASDPTDVNTASAQVGQVALSANVNVAEGVTASITVLAENNMAALSIDQAVVEVAPENLPFVFLFGQQSFNFGLLTTRLISDPSMIDAVSTSGPGIAANFSRGVFTPGFGVTYFHEDAQNGKMLRINFADSSVIAADTIEKPESNLFTGIVNCDIGLPNESTVRIATRFSGDIVDLTLGAGISVGPVALDAELFGTLNDADDTKAAGYYAGAAWTINDRIQAAMRYDGMSEDAFNDIIHRIGLGATFSFRHGIFCAAEYSVDDIGSDDPQQQIALQVGLESTIKLPGFQRKTLTRK